GGDVVEHPFLVAQFLLDVLRHGFPEPLPVAAEAGAGGHQQRHRVLDVVVGLGEKGDVLVAADLARQGLFDQRRGQQSGAVFTGGGYQLVVERHGVTSGRTRGLGRRSRGGRRASRAPWRWAWWASRGGCPWAVPSP